MKELPSRFIISVLTHDRVGVIADVTESLYGLGANLEALSQTVVWGWFTMIICAAFPKGTTAEQVTETLESIGAITATVMPFGKGKVRPPVDGEPFVVTVVGDDKPGIVRRLTRTFADKGVNIEDVWNEVRQGQFIVIFHVTVPRDIDRKEVRYELEQAAGELGVSVMLHHQDVFTATNSLALRTTRGEHLNR